MKPPALTRRSLRTGIAQKALWLAACCTWSVSAQMLAPKPNPEIPDAPAQETSVPVRVVKVPGGLMVERTDIPSDQSTDTRAVVGAQAQEPNGRYRIVATLNGGRMLEAVDAAPPPESRAMDADRLVVQLNAAGQRMLKLRDELPSKPYAGPRLRVVDIVAGARGPAVPTDPEPFVLYRVVKP